MAGVTGSIPVVPTIRDYIVVIEQLSLLRAIDARVLLCAIPVIELSQICNNSVAAPAYGPRHNRLASTGMPGLTHTEVL